MKITEPQMHMLASIAAGMCPPTSMPTETALIKKGLVYRGGDLKLHITPLGKSKLK